MVHTSATLKTERWVAQSLRVPLLIHCFLVPGLVYVWIMRQPSSSEFLIILIRTARGLKWLPSHPDHRGSNSLPFSKNTKSMGPRLIRILQTNLSLNLLYSMFFLKNKEKEISRRKWLVRPLPSRKFCVCLEPWNGWEPHPSKKQYCEQVA